MPVPKASLADVEGLFATMAPMKHSSEFQRGYEQVATPHLADQVADQVAQMLQKVHRAQRTL